MALIVLAGFAFVWFQSLIGRLQTGVILDARAQTAAFQSLIGRLQTLRVTPQGHDAP